MKTKKIQKNGLPERKRQPNFIENGILSPKNSKDESFGDLKLFQNQTLGNYLQNEVWGKSFSKSKRIGENGR